MAKRKSIIVDEGEKMAVIALYNQAVSAWNDAEKTVPCAGRVDVHGKTVLFSFDRGRITFSVKPDGHTYRFYPARIKMFKDRGFEREYVDPTKVQRVERDVV